MKQAKTLALLVVILLAACNPYQLTQNPGKYYRFNNYGQPAEFENLSGAVSFQTLALYAGNYGMYTDTAATVNGAEITLRTRRLPAPVTVDWITQEQILNKEPVHPFYFSTGGLQSVESFRPPFHIQVISTYLYRADILESVWLMNRNCMDSTRELDLFESGNQEIIPGLWNRRRLWFADHYAERCYTNRQARIVELYLPPSGYNQVDIFVDKDGARRYLNGRLVMVSKKNLNDDFWILVTLIVAGPEAGPVDWHIKKLSIKKL